MIDKWNEFKNWLHNIFYGDNKKKKIFFVIGSFFIFLILFVLIDIIYTYGCSQEILDYIYPAGNNFDNLLYIGVSMNFRYMYYMLEISYINLIFYFSNLFLLLVDSYFLQSTEMYLFYLNNLMINKGSNDIYMYVFNRSCQNDFNMYFMYYEYFNEKFFPIILYNSNLPIFFYFGLLFILTNISSLFLLSYYGFYGVFFINLVSIVMFWISTVFYIDMFFLDNLSYNINLGKWFVVSLNYTIYFEIFIDSVSYSFMFLTLTIAVFVYIYSFSYFRYEPNVERLILLINCFVISMVCLVTSGNFFVLFLGWELIGLTSFFLINFWSTRISTLKSSFKAFVFNKLSDASLLLAILLVFFASYDCNIQSFLVQIGIYNNYYLIIFGREFPVVEVLSFFFIICAFIKSAQFGFHIWLPDSMEAPVPASALIHSATLVSAGVFLLLRLSPMFEYSLYSYYVVPIVGSFTAFFGGLCSMYQSDIKKILAYSTISHCGFLMVCYSTYIPEFTILYLYIHGFFKAAVFLCVGNIIRFSRNYQDFRRMGMYWKYLPFECFSSFICLINLCGLPFTIGFYIKHLLLLGVNMDIRFSYFIFANILGGAVSGLVYSFRLFYSVFFDFKKAKKIIYLQANRLNLDSNFYSNTTLASNISISLLIIFAYFICLYLFNLFLNKTSLGEGLDIYSIHSSQYEEFNHPLLSTINNIGYFNWFLIIIVLCLILYPWRRVYKYYNVINTFSNVITFFIFFYIFYIILTI